MEINWILKMIVFGSGPFTNNIVNLKHQGACRKLVIGRHKHQGVSETLKNADVICEQPLFTNGTEKQKNKTVHTKDLLMLW